MAMASVVAPPATLFRPRSSSSSAFPLLTPSASASFPAIHRPLALRAIPARTNSLSTRLHTPTTTSPRDGFRCCAHLEALVFDCDGVILESEDLHRRAYNAAFQEFRICCNRIEVGEELLVWTPEFYDVLQNTIGGGKPKMRWYFAKYGWPTSTILPTVPSTEEEQAILIDTIQDWKTEKYQKFIGSGDVEPRPGVLELMDATREKGLKLAVCSAATKSSVVFTLSNLLGKERFEGLDCFLAGDDVDKKKPDPTIYIKAAQALGVAPENCMVIEDSVIGLKAASGASMPCIISYTSSTSAQDFKAAKAVYPNLGSVRLEDLMELLEGTPVSL